MSVITEINKLIDSHPDSFVECPGCERCKQIQKLMKSAPKKQRKVVPEEFIADEPVKRPKKITPEIIEKAAGRGISESLLRSRVYDHGMSVVEALSKPLRKDPPFSKEEQARAAANGISYNTLMTRHYKGWDKEKAMTEPVDKSRGKEPAFTKEERAEAEKNGIPYVTLMQRYRSGWDKHTAMTQPPNQKFSKNKGRATG